MSFDSQDSYERLLPRIRDVNLSKNIRNLVRPIMTEDWKIRLNWLQDRGWIAIPVIFSIMEEDASQLAQTVLKKNWDKCYAVRIWEAEPLDVFQVTISEIGLVALGGESHIHPMLMIPLDLSFLVFSTADPDYHVIAGTSNFVLDCLRFSIEETRKRFEVEMSLEDDIHSRLMQDILEYYGQYLKS